MLAEAVFVVTAYAVGCDVKGSHPTKAGTLPVVGFTVAADPSVLPIGSLVHIEDVGERMVHDVGGLVKGRHLDVFMDTCREANAWGHRKKLVRVLHVPKERRRQVETVVVRKGG